MLKKGFNLPFKSSQLAFLHYAVSSMMILIKNKTLKDHGLQYFVKR
jgi:hypothetical protein